MNTAPLPQNTPLPRGVPLPDLWEKSDKSKLPDFLRNYVRPQAPEWDPEDDMDLESASCGGHGTLEMLEVSRGLEENGILCAFCGVSALIYYGAGRVRDDWDICVPSDLVEKAVAILKSEERSHDYFPVASQPIPYPGSLRHTYHRFRVRNFLLHFNIVPVDDIHLELVPDKIQRSRYGLPYPKLSRPDPKLP